MSLFSKLAFWKKDDDLNFDNLADKELNQGTAEGGMPVHDNLGLEEKSPFGDPPTELNQANEPFSPQRSAEVPPQQPTQQLTSGNRDLELISSKLDTIKAILGSLDQRIANLEKLSVGENKKEEKLW